MTTSLLYDDFSCSLLKFGGSSNKDNIVLISIVLVVWLVLICATMLQDIDNKFTTVCPHASASPTYITIHHSQVVAQQKEMKESLYDILGIPRNASADDIKRAYKKLALKHHPDKNKDNPDAEAQFKKLTEAYTILSNDDKRAQYDQFGTVDEIPPMPDMNDIFSQLFGGMPNGGGGGGGGGMPFSFSSMFGGFGGHEEPQGPTMEVMHVDVSLAEVYEGSKKTITFNITDMCQTCHGSGAQGGSNNIINCMACGGRGMVTQQLSPFMISTQRCSACGGNGKMIKDGKKCNACHGQKTARTSKTIDVKLPKGLPNAHQHKCEGRGNYNVRTKRHNDIVLIFNYKVSSEQGVASIDCNGTIHVEVDVKLDEIICGFKRTISPYGKEITIYSTSFVNPQNPIVLKGRGLPHYKKDTYADMVINLNVKYTDDLVRMNKYRDVFHKIFKKKDEDVLTDAPMENAHCVNTKSHE